MDKKGPAPVYYFYGDEDLLIEEAIAGIKKKYLSPGFESMNQQVYEGKNIDVADAVAVASTMPAFSQMRIVIVAGAESLKAADQKALLAYVKDPSPTTAFIFFARTYKVNKTAALFKYINSKKWARLFRELSEDEAARWAVKYALENGKAMAPHASRRLVATVGTRLRDLKGELEKLISYVGSADSIEEGDVEQSALTIRGDNAFDLADAMAARKLGRALVLLKTLSGEEPLMVIGALSWNFRQLVRTKPLMNKGLDQYTLARRLHVSVSNVRRYQAACSRFSEGELLGVMGRLSEADTAIKTGLLPGDMALLGLVVSCCRT